MKLWKLAIAPALGLLVCSGIMAQDGEPEVQESRMQMTVIGADDGAAPMIFSSTNGGGMMSFSGVPGSYSIGGGDFAMPAPNPWSMVNNPSVQKDLELVGEQLDKVKDLQREHGAEMQKHIGSLKNGSLDLGNLDALKESMARLKTRQQEQLKKLLLPHQIERLQQIALQTHMRQSGTANALANKKVVEKLGISEDQVKNLKKKAKELKEKMAKDIEELKKKMKEELLKELTSEQRETLNSLTGDQYQPKDDDWKERFSPMINRVRNRNRGD